MFIHYNDYAVHTGGFQMKKSVWTDEEGKTETVQNLIEKLFSYAMDRGVSDIHAEPLDEKFRIRCRRDGVLESAGAIRKEKGKAFINRLKVMAALDIADARRPQDGRIVYKEGIDMRLSTMPTVRGEKAVIRILGGSRNLPDLDGLGMDKRAVSLIRRSLRDAKGLIIICGPTGSGKTTTLYAALREIDKESVSIATLEDPVEYKIDGLSQSQIGKKGGIAFHEGLRALLRQDPDVLVIGEIRDNETAAIAVRAALTGHLVFSTIHANEAAAVPERLVDMGVPAYLVGDALVCTAAQRLVRKQCSVCGGTGCLACNFSGYDGRGCLAEVIYFTNRTKEAVRRDASTGAVRKGAQEKIFFKETAMAMVRDGLTDEREIMRVCGEDHEY